MPKKPTGKRTATRKGVTVHGKNANGEGSVYPLPDGTWRATWRDRTGRRRTVRGRTRAVALERRDTAIAADRGPAFTFGQDTTVAQLAAWWVENVAATAVRPSSLTKYQARVQRVVTGLGHVKVTDLRAETVATWLTELTRQGLATGTVRDTRSTLSQVLATAVDLELVATNVVGRVRPPKVQRRDARALTVAETRLLLAAAEGQRLGPAVWLLFTAGWRVSEVLGLAWEDVDLDAGTAHVRRAAVYVDGEGMRFGPPKSAGAQGVHALAPGLVRLLRQWRAVQAGERLATGALWEQHRWDGRPVSPVFTAADGRLVTRQRVTKVIQACAEAAGLDPTGLATHTGRRTVVTALYGVEGLDLADVARLVGHADPKTTAGYVRSLGVRPGVTSAAAHRLLSP